MGFSYIVRAFLTLVTGGLGSVAGAGVGAAGLGTAETVLTTVTSSVTAQLLVFGGVAVILLVRSRIAGARSR
jgi:branched-subunit amino acid ABC-type transport system permease component